jgi:hypothetical protein
MLEIRFKRDLRIFQKYGNPPGGFVSVPAKPDVHY